jgi:cathepsin C
MVYDEGFSLNFEEFSFFAFSNYNIENNNSTQKFQSKCFSTCVGWYNNNTHWGCYRAFKLVNEPEQVTSYSNDKGVNIIQPEKTIQNAPVIRFKSVGDKFITQKVIESSFLAEQETITTKLTTGFTKHHLYINKLNTIPKSWTAALHNSFQSLTVGQLNKLAGIPRANHFRFKSKEMPVQEDLSQFPKEFNWKDKLKPAGSQGNCGSCYVYSTIRMIQARLKILYDHDVDLSVQHAIDCSFYNQGCNGGYPYLVMKYGNEFEYIPESCKSYQEANGECFKNTCNITELDYIYKTKDYKYIGGSYGKCTEKTILEEVHKHGPIVVSFEPDYNFMMYKTGIYHEIEEKLSVPKPEWEKVDHSVLLVGWGEENGEKFWLIQNTWGPEWGEDGFFRMLRGKDEFGIESICEAAMPVIIDNKTKKQITSKFEVKSIFELFK